VGSEQRHIIGPVVKRGGHLVGFCLAIGLLVGCGGKSREAAQAATEKFRARVMVGEYAQIYGQAEPEFRASATEAQFEKLMKAVERKLGRWQAAAEPAWRVNIGTGGRTVFLGYKSEFEKGSASEEFIWRVKDPAPTLVGYHINSPAFLAD
jgi:hypothetical protein